MCLLAISSLPPPPPSIKGTGFLLKWLGVSQCVNFCWSILGAPSPVSKVALEGWRLASASCWFLAPGLATGRWKGQRQPKASSSAALLSCTFPADLVPASLLLLSLPSVCSNGTNSQCIRVKLAGLRNPCMSGLLWGLSGDSSSAAAGRSEFLFRCK